MTTAEEEIKERNKIFEAKYKQVFDLSTKNDISNQAWALIKNAKEEMISLINSVQAKEDDKITATKFAGNLFEQFAGKKNPLEQAMDVLKEEIQSRFA